MATETVEGWLLHKTPQGDTSLNLSFFCLEKGLVRASYRGGRSKKQLSLQPFTPLWFSLNEQRDWHYIQKAEALGATIFLEGKALFAALYINELLYYTLAPLEPYPSLFKAYEFTIENLARAKELFTIEITLRYFEKELLTALGEGIAFDVEAGSLMPIKENLFYEFKARVGFQQTKDNGILGADIIQLAQGKLDNPQILKLAKVIMRKAIDSLLNGRELKSRAFAKAHASLKET